MPRTTCAQKYLDPSESLGEVLFGLIMVLTFTLGAGLIVREGEDAVREMIVGIIGCNIAWGVIDGGMYIMTALFERSQNARLWRAVKGAGRDDEALAIVGGWLDPQLSALTSPSVRARLSEDVLTTLRRAEPVRPTVTRHDVYGAIASFWLVVLSAIPAVLPFLIFDSRYLALRVSNGLLLGLLFLVGYRWSEYTNGRPWISGLAMLAAGGALVAVAMAFGG